MESNQNKDNSKPEVKEKSKIKTFFGNLKGEFKKIVWPSRQELGKQTLVVIVISLLMGVIIFGMDSVLKLILAFVTNLAV